MSRKYCAHKLFKECNLFTFQTNFFEIRRLEIERLVQSAFTYREPRRLGIMLDKKLWLIEDDHRQGKTLKVELGTYEFSED